MTTRFILYIIFIFNAALAAQTGLKFVSVTVDDLPVNSQDTSYQNQLYITKNLIDKITAANVAAIGFVNEGKLYADNELQNERVNLLKMWIDAGLELGNHTYSHRSLNRTSLDEYTKDIIKGEKIIKELSGSIKYFRHPFLHTGLSEEIKSGCTSFLKEHNYITAPVTIDNSEWIYARAYENAFLNNDKKLQDKIAVDYINYMNNVFKYYEEQSIKFFGRDIKHILLIHSNRLNADTFDELAGMIAARGYKFIPLDEALTDEVYNSEDKFYKNNGISWLHRWALTADKRGDFFAGEPVPEKYINDTAGIDGY